MSGPRQIGWPELKAGGFYHTTSRQCFKVVASRGTAGDPPVPPLGPAVVTQRQLAQLLGTHLEGITILRAYNGIGFGTDQGTYGVAMRDGGLEVMLDGVIVWSSTPTDTPDEDTTEEAPHSNWDLDPLKRIV